MFGFCLILVEFRWNNVNDHDFLYLDAHYFHDGDAIFTINFYEFASELWMMCFLAAFHQPSVSLIYVFRRMFDVCYSNVEFQSIFILNIFLTTNAIQTLKSYVTKTVEFKFKWNSAKTVFILEIEAPRSTQNRSLWNMRWENWTKTVLLQSVVKIHFQPISDSYFLVSFFGRDKWSSHSVFQLEKADFHWITDNNLSLFLF